MTDGPKFRVAMPIAHQTNLDYSDYYVNSLPIYEVVNYFGRGDSEGLQLKTNASGISNSDVRLNLYAFTDGFLSLQMLGLKKALVLRLATELAHRKKPEYVYNSGKHFQQLKPAGPQLRHVLHVFDDAPGDEQVRATICALLANATHPGRKITRVIDKEAKRTIKLDDFLARDKNNEDLVAADFLAGEAQIFVQAGDVIGSVGTHKVDLRFIDSCGPMKPTKMGEGPIEPTGRAINFSYFLYLVRAATNASSVSLLTAWDPFAVDPNDTHPLDKLLSVAAVTSRSDPPSLALDANAGHPPPPLLITVPVKKGNMTIAGRGIPVDSLTEWHESRNAANPLDTKAPVRWRYYGSAADGAPGDWTKLVAKTKTGRKGRKAKLPEVYDLAFTPNPDEYQRTTGYWNRYADVFNLLADRFEVPCEFLLAISCTESSGHEWYDPVLANSRETALVHLDPLANDPSKATASPNELVLLGKYFAVAGAVRGKWGANRSRGASAAMPLPWQSSAIIEGTELTWGQLRDLVRDPFLGVTVAVGLMQTPLYEAYEDMKWLESMYGPNAIHQTQTNGPPALSITYNNKDLVADAFPSSPDDLLSEWFGVSVDGDGNNSTDSAQVDQVLSKMKRALHSIIAGTAHVKRFYNTVWKDRNLVSDFDFPTAASALRHEASPGKRR